MRAEVVVVTCCLVSLRALYSLNVVWLEVDCLIERLIVGNVRNASVSKGLNVWLEVSYRETDSGQCQECLSMLYSGTIVATMGNEIRSFILERWPYLRG